jgi:hypothetical protein
MSKGIFSAVCAATLALAGAASAQDTAAQETGAVETATSVSSAPPTSSASINPGKLRILGGLHFGGGGDLRIDPDGGGGTLESSLAPVVGLQGGVDYVMMDYFALGGELRATFFNTSDGADGDLGRSTFIDLDVKPRGRYVFDFPLEVYGTLPMGLTIAAINDDWNADGGAGFNLGFGGGANYFFTDKIGVNAEMAAIWHWFGAEYPTGFGTSVDAALRTAQFYMFLNFVYAI